METVMAAGEAQSRKEKGEEGSGPAFVKCPLSSGAEAHAPSPPHTLSDDSESGMDVDGAAHGEELSRKEKGEEGSGPAFVKCPLSSGAEAHAPSPPHTLSDDSESGMDVDGAAHGEELSQPMSQLSVHEGAGEQRAGRKRPRLVVGSGDESNGRSLADATDTEGSDSTGLDLVLSCHSQMDEEMGPGTPAFRDLFGNINVQGMNGALRTVIEKALIPAHGGLDNIFAFFVTMQYSPDKRGGKYQHLLEFLQNVEAEGSDMTEGVKLAMFAASIEPKKTGQPHAHAIVVLCSVGGTNVYAGARKWTQELQRRWVEHGGSAAFSRFRPQPITNLGADFMAHIIIVVLIYIWSKTGKLLGVFWAVELDIPVNAIGLPVFYIALEENSWMPVLNRQDHRQLFAACLAFSTQPLGARGTPTSADGMSAGGSAGGSTLLSADERKSRGLNNADKSTSQLKADGATSCALCHSNENGPPGKLEDGSDCTKPHYTSRGSILLSADERKSRGLKNADKSTSQLKADAATSCALCHSNENGPPGKLEDGSDCTKPHYTSRGSILLSADERKSRGLNNADKSTSQLKADAATSCALCHSDENGPPGKLEDGSDCTKPHYTSRASKRVTTGESRLFRAQGRTVRFKFFRNCGKCRAEGKLRWSRTSGNGPTRGFQLMTRGCRTGHSEDCHMDQREFGTGDSAVGQTGFEMWTENGEWQEIGDRTALERLFPRPEM